MALEPTYPIPVVIVGGEDVTELVTPGSLRRLMTERGDATADFDVQLSGENEVASNAIVKDAAVEVVVEGTRRWYGDVVNVTQPQPGEYVASVVCAGVWDRLHHRQDYLKGFVETRIDGVATYAANQFPSFSLTPSANINVDLDGQILMNLPQGNAIKAGQGCVLYLWPLDGFGSGIIKRITGRCDASGSGILNWVIYQQEPSAFASTYLLSRDSGTTSAGSSGAFDATTLSSPTCLVFALYTSSDRAAATSDNSIQIRDLSVYIDRITAPRIDQAALEIWTDITGLTDSVTETIGSALTQLMIDPFTDGADAISQVLAKATVPPLCGCIHGQFKCLSRPTAPTDNTHLWVVSEQATPGLQWDVKADVGERPEYVALTYAQIIASPTTTPSGLPAIAYYHGVAADYSAPPSNTTRTLLIDSGTELTEAEAQAAVQQAWAFYASTVPGTVTVPYYARNGNGQEVPVEHIECWDWVLNDGKSDPDEAGPFLISEVEIQDGVATLTIGATEGYNYESPYRLPAKGRYVGAHRQRTKHELYGKWARRNQQAAWKKYLKSTKAGKRTWKTFAAYAKAHPIPKHHNKYHDTYRDVEGRYT